MQRWPVHTVQRWPEAVQCRGGLRQCSAEVACSYSAEDPNKTEFHTMKNHKLPFFPTSQAAILPQISTGPHTSSSASLCQCLLKTPTLSVLCVSTISVLVFTNNPQSSHTLRRALFVVFPERLVAAYYGQDGGSD